jgi:hypothetical protein
MEECGRNPQNNLFQFENRVILEKNEFFPATFGPYRCTSFAAAGRTIPEYDGFLNQRFESLGPTNVLLGTAVQVGPVLQSTRIWPHDYDYKYKPYHRARRLCIVLRPLVLLAREA